MRKKRREEVDRADQTLADDALRLFHHLTDTARAHTKYSLAADITPANVGRLATAWQWQTGERPLPNGTRAGVIQATPLMIDNVLYLINKNLVTVGSSTPIR